MGNACAVRRWDLNNGFLQSPYDILSNPDREHANETALATQNEQSKQVMPIQNDSVLTTKTDNFEANFSLGRKLGQGNFGSVFLCVEKATSKEYACKMIEKKKLIRDDDIEGIRKEIQIMQHLAGHPNVASIQGAYEDFEAVHIVMELCTGGELFDRIKQRGHYTEREAAGLTRTIVSVVESFHSLGVMHRDIKPENFLFVNQQEDSPIKLIDFGLSTFFAPDEKFSSLVGTLCYIAPEVLQRNYGPEAEIWSAGVILYILLCGVPPFWAETVEAMHEQLLPGDLEFSSDPWPTISESAKDLVRRMLDRDPVRRITAKEIFCHPWVQVDDVVPDPDKVLDPAGLNLFDPISQEQVQENGSYSEPI